MYQDNSSIEYAMPVSQQVPPESNKTDKTDSSNTNEDFLKAIFGALQDEARPVICSNAESDGSGEPGDGLEQGWIPGAVTLPGEADNYFTLATYKPNKKGEYHREKRQFSALYAVFLEGVNSPGLADLESRLQPSWIIETSLEIYQVGYLFSKPLTYSSVAEELVKKFSNVHRDPLGQLARLPVGRNSKNNPVYSCCLRQFHPEYRYGERDIRALLSQKGALYQGGRTGSEDDDELYIPPKLENPVITQLRSQGRYRRLRGHREHEILCPWSDAHAKAYDEDSWALYSEPDEQYPVGMFKCRHGSCANRNIMDLLGLLRIGKDEAKNITIIKVGTGDLHREVDSCERVLALTGTFFRRGGEVVKLSNDPHTMTAELKTLAPINILHALSKLALFQRYDKRTKKWMNTEPRKLLCELLSKDWECTHLPYLANIARQPYFRSDGSLMTKSGYDPVSRILGLFNDKEFDVVEKPTREKAMEAVNSLTELLEEFAFETEEDRSAVLSGFLTAAIRPSLAQAPMFHCCAPQIGSGKSYLTSLISLFAAPVIAPPISYPENGDECRKKLVSLLRVATPVILFDNLTSVLRPHAALSSALTEESISDRLLGGNDMLRVNTRVLFLSNGNNVMPLRDLTRRIIPISLDPVVEIPTERDFKKKPLELVKRNRGKYLSLALTIIQAYKVAGQPSTEARSLASFDEWSVQCRQPLLWLGYPDPATHLFRSMKDEPDRAELGYLLRVWNEIFGQTPKMLREALTDERIKEVCEDIASENGTINRKRLGNWIKKRKGVIVDRLRFEEDPGIRSSKAWRVVRVEKQA